MSAEPIIQPYPSNKVNTEPFIDFFRLDLRCKISLEITKNYFKIHTLFLPVGGEVEDLRARAIGLVVGGRHQQARAADVCLFDIIVVLPRHLVALVLKLREVEVTRASAM